MHNDEGTDEEIARAEALTKRLAKERAAYEQANPINTYGLNSTEIFQVMYALKASGYITIYTKLLGVETITYQTREKL